MTSMSRMNLASAFAIDREQVRETSRRQLAFSVIVVLAALGVAFVAQMRPVEEARLNSAKLAKAMIEANSAHTVRAQVRYVDRTPSAHELASAGY